MEGTWIDINVTPDHSLVQRKVPARAFVRNCILKEVTKRDLSGLGIVYKADFIYLKESQTIIKNRAGDIDRLYDNSRRYMELKYHENENVRKAFEKAETLAALTEK